MKYIVNKYCVNCKYSAWVNNRYLCTKHGKTIEEDDYCHDFNERNISIFADMDCMYAEPDPEIANSFMYADTDSVKVVKPKVRGLRSHLRIFYYKWIKGNCRHFCRFCKYTNDCIDEIDYIANRSGKF